MSATGSRTSGRRRNRDTTRSEVDRALFECVADRRDPVDRELLVERFLPLARSIAARYRRPGEPFDDVFQVACLGLLNAIDRYDATRGQAFSSFATPTIAGEIKRYYRDRTWSVHVPRDLQELTIAVDRARDELEMELSRSPTVDEVAQRLGVDGEDVVEALHARHAKKPASLDAPQRADGDSSSTVRDHIAAHETGFEQAEARADLRALSRVLTRRERLVLRLRFEADLTQQEVGERVGISQMQVSRILRSSIDRLRQYGEQGLRDRDGPRAEADAKRHRLAA